MLIRNLQYDDYNKNYLELLEQLTIVNKENISQVFFNEFIDNLNNNHKIMVLEDLRRSQSISSSSSTKNI